MKALGSLFLEISFGFILLGCGAGTAAIAGSGGNGDSDANTPPVGSGLRVTNAGDDGQRPAASPATIRFDLADAEGDNAAVELSFAVKDAQGVASTFRPITQDASVILDLDSTPTNRGEISVKWDFSADLGDESFRDNVVIRLVVVSGVSPQALEGVAVGNDPPVIATNLLPPSSIGGNEPNGNVDVKFKLGDASGDRVDVRVRFDVVGDVPDAGFVLARPAATALDADTPEFAMEDLQLSTSPSTLTFRWDSAFPGVATNPKAPPQLAGKEQDVVFEFTVRERLVDDDQKQIEVSSATAAFRVDNNRAPTAILLNDQVVLNPDQRRGIPIPFQVADDESDLVRVVIQWARPGELAPPLPPTAAETIDLLDNPERADERRQLQIASQVPGPFVGRVGSAPGLLGDQVRLPELASTAAGLLANGILGAQLDVLRGSRIPTPVTWPASPLDQPIAAVPVGNGRTAWILDREAPGWRVREIDLATGSILDLVASGSGDPRAMAIGRDGKHLFVGSSTHLFRIALANRGLVSSIPHSFVDGPRGMASLGTDAVVCTGDSVLSRHDFGDSLEFVLMGGLAEPWGVAFDQTIASVLYVAESGRDRVLAVDLTTLVPMAVAARIDPDDASDLGLVPFPRPRALALDGSGSQLLVMTEVSGKASLRGVGLRSPSDVDGNLSTLAADPFVFEITNEFPDPEANLATGEDNLVVVPLRSSNAVAVGGGLEQDRRVLAYDPTDQVASVDAAFAPPIGPDRFYRITPRLFRSAPNGSPSTFLWDSGDVPGGGDVILSIEALDSDVGLRNTGVAPKSVVPGFVASISPVAEPVHGIEDLDADGDLDLWSQALGELHLYFQVDRGVFVASPHGPMLVPGLVAADTGDLDGDGDADIATLGNALIVHFQTSPGIFDPDTGGATVAPPASASGVAIAELNADDLPDLVMRRFDGLAVVLQDKPTVPNHFEVRSVQEFVGLQRLGQFGRLDSSIADLDRDGDLDLLGIVQQSPGQFVDSGSSLPVQLSFGQIAMVDLDGDGDNDVAATNPFGLADEVHLFLQTGDGTLVPHPKNPAPGFTGFFNPPIVVAADLDDDLDNDLVVGSTVSGGLGFFVQQHPGQFVRADVPLLHDPATDLTVADIDGDGDADLATAAGIVYQVSPGDLTPNPSEPITDTSIKEAFNSSVGDLDQDGDIDLISSSDFFGALTIFLQSTPGRFATHPGQPIQASGAGSDVIAIDLDGDADLDIAAADFSSISLIFQTSPGEFITEPQDDLFAPGIGYLHTGDFDSNGSVDLVSGSELFFQTALGQFVADRNGALAISVDHAADLDGDGATDVVGFDESAASILFQVSPGNFAPNPDDENLDFCGETMSGDLDGDGDVDIVSRCGDSIELRFQSQFRVFGDDFELVPHVTSGFALLRVGDMDLDGDLDLVTADDAGIVVFDQIAPGRFVRDPQQLTAPSGPSIVDMDLVDVDGDGELDIVSFFFDQNLDGEFRIYYGGR